MNSILWIPCHEEGDQHVEFKCPESGDIISTTRHTLYSTLNLLKPKIQSGIFDKIVITDDGSTDNTQEGIVRFLGETGFSPQNLKVIGSSTRMGKMARFFEMMDIYGRSGEGVLTITDADMVYVGGNAFDLLSSPAREFPNKMLVSHQAEYNPSSEKFDVYDQESSGTRSIIIPQARSVFQKEGFSTDNFPGTGYGLEALLNKYLGGDYHVNGKDDAQNIPRFLRSYRKEMINQDGEISFTKSMIRLRSPLELIEGQEKHSLIFHRTANGIRIDITYSNGTMKSMEIYMSVDDLWKGKIGNPLTEIIISILGSCDPYEGIRQSWGELHEVKNNGGAIRFCELKDEADRRLPWKSNQKMIDKLTNYLHSFCDVYHQSISTQ